MGGSGPRGRQSLCQERGRARGALGTGSRCQNGSDRGTAEGALSGWQGVLWASRVG